MISLCSYCGISFTIQQVLRNWYNQRLWLQTNRVLSVWHSQMPQGLLMYLVCILPPPSPKVAAFLNSHLTMDQTKQAGDNQPHCCTWYRLGVNIEKSKNVSLNCKSSCVKSTHHNIASWELCSLGVLRSKYEQQK